MKYLMTITIAILFTGMCLAQNLEFEITKIEFNDEKVEVVQTNLEPGSDEVREAFENYMDDTYGVDLDGKKFLFFDKGYIMAEAINVPEISDKNITLYAKTSESKNGPTALNIFASTGNSNWITDNENPGAFKAMKNIARKFTADYLPDYYNSEIKKAKEAVANLESDVNDMKDEIEDNENKITTKKDEIEELKKENVEIEGVIADTERKIEKAKKAVGNRKSDLDNAEETFSNTKTSKEKKADDKEDGDEDRNDKDTDDEDLDKDEKDDSSNKK